MNTRQKITEELVYRLADELVALGQNPTNTSVRARNGDYGSPNDIAPHLRRWKAEQLEKQEQANKPARDLPGHLHELFMPLWVALNKEADKDLEEARQQYEAELSERANAIAELVAALERADERYLALEQQLEAAESTGNTLRTEKEDVESALNESRSRADKLSNELNECNAEIDVLEKQVQQHTTLEQKLRESEYQAKGEAAQLRRDLKKSETAVEKYRREAEKLTGDLAVQEQLASDQAEKCNALAEENGTIRTECDQAKGEAAQLRRDLKKSETAVEKYRREAEKLTGDLAVQEQLASDQAEKCNALAEENGTIRTECDQAKGEAAQLERLLAERTGQTSELQQLTGTLKERVAGLQNQLQQAREKLLEKNEKTDDSQNEISFGKRG